MRSIVGVGMTPPNVLGTPNPESSVMMSSTLGAPFGGTTRGAHHGLDCNASFLITPPNFGSAGGSCFPSIVVVALGEPSVPVVPWAQTEEADAMVRAMDNESASMHLFIDASLQVQEPFSDPSWQRDELEP